MVRAFSLADLLFSFLSSIEENVVHLHFETKTECCLQNKMETRFWGKEKEQGARTKWKHSIETRVHLNQTFSFQRNCQFTWTNGQLQLLSKCIQVGFIKPGIPFTLYKFLASKEIWGWEAISDQKQTHRMISFGWGSKSRSFNLQVQTSYISWPAPWLVAGKLDSNKIKPRLSWYLNPR